MYSSVGVFRDGQVEVVPNERGNRATPSFVAFTADGRRLIGEAALEQLPDNPANTLFNVKRILGRAWDDKFVQNDLQFADYTLVQRGRKPLFSVSTPAANLTLTPEEVAAMVLAKMKEVAEAYLGHGVSQAVVSVPAFFNDAQRQATKDAAAIAGLTVREILNEPTAAAIAYGIRKDVTRANVLVLDVGGGTFDASVLRINDGVYQVAATGGNTSLGGEDFNQRIVEYFIELFKRSQKLDFKGDTVTIQRIRPHIEKAKRSLSFGNYVWVEVPSLVMDTDFTEPFYRLEFEDISRDLLQSVVATVESVLDDSGLQRSEIDDILLVGGSTRIPLLQKMLSEALGGKEYCRGLNPDETVAYGAAAHAAVLAGKDISNIVVVDVNPLTLGIETNDAVMSPMIRRNSAIPAKKSQIFSTVVDNQEMITFKVFEGERPLTKDNHFLGEFTLRLQPAPRGVPQIEVTFEVNTDGLLRISALDTGTGRREELTITNDDKRLSKEDIERMVRTSQDLVDEDTKLHDWLNSRNNFEFYAYQVKGRIFKEGAALFEDEKNAAERAIEEKLRWLQDHPDAAIDEVLTQRRELEKVVEPIVAKIAKKDEL
ncbi:heat shock protein cognate 3 [Penaeus vannamei]|uniref:Heat shock protein cognate 3 n=1 Tax=Penaeus vannamei TaxID=6689 RepID=A0A423TS73_PENVA|nr:heat shock protein cognate 3 [Penaeus vannamei]